MDKFNQNLAAIRRATTQQGVSAYLYGDFAKFIITEDEKFHRSCLMQVAIVRGDNFDVNGLYKSLSSQITINSQVENTREKYCIISDTYIIDFILLDKFDPQKDYSRFANFTVDAVFYDIINSEIVDPTGRGTADLKSSTIKAVDNDWNIKTVLGFAKKLGTFLNGKIDADDDLKLNSTNLINARLDPSTSLNDLLKDMLLSEFPGRAIKFISERFDNGTKWIFSSIIDLLVSLHVAMPENIMAENVISDKKLDLIDVYNEFFLFEKQEAESPLEKKKRLTTTLRLLMDAPSLNIETPYIDRVTSLSQSIFATTEVEDKTSGQIFSAGVNLFMEPAECPPYGCPVCVPEDCDPPCCCCSTLDIVSQIKANCHEQIVLSCNEAGDGPGPGPCDNNVVNSCFPDECENCEEACDLAQDGIGNAIKCAQLENQDWWVIPNTFSPCECSCREGFELGGGGCALTCVKCNNLFCESSIEISGEDCNYNMTMFPGSGCCGAPAVLAWMFCIDVSGSTSTKRNDIADQIDSLVDALAEKGASVRFGVTVFGRQSSVDPALIQDFTTDIEATKDIVRNFGDAGGKEYDLETVVFAAGAASWGQASSNFMMLIADEKTQVRSSGQLNTKDEWLQAAIDSVLDRRISVFVVDSTDTTPTGPPSPSRLQLAVASGGERFSWADPFEDIVDNLDITVFPTSCDCVDNTPIKLRLATQECLCCKDGVQNPCIDDPTDLDCINALPDHCFDIPIKQCVQGQDCNDPDFCKQAIPLNACGNTVIIAPTRANLLCCSDIGLGCDCPTDPCDTECCGSNCPGSEVCVDGQLLYPPGPTGLRQAQDEVWCNCWTVKASISDLTPNCSHCCCPEPDSTPGDPNFPCDLLDPGNPQHQQLLSEGNCCECSSIENIRTDCCECCLLFPDGERDPDTGECGFSSVICKPQIDAEVKAIFESCGQPPEPPQPFDCVNLQCPEDDEIISGFDDCSAVRHPDTVVLSNGVGLVAYEDQDDVSIIKIKQFKTSILNKLLPNREFNFGRLENSVRWTNSVAKLYYFDPLPDHLLTEPTVPIDPDDPETWIDGIVFRTGPLTQQCFPISPPAATDGIGDYINILIPSGTSPTIPFASSDDAYNVKWFLFDFEDTGVIGDAVDITTAGKDYIISDRTVVDAILQLPSHIYNGESVPVAFPSLASAVNYSGALENSHFIYLTYQALEDGKWNIYLRQIRLSEYERESQISGQQSQLISLENLNIGQVIYQIVCTNDSCTELGDGSFLLKRGIILEVLLEDGREVFNNGLSGNWPSLCPGFESSDFPKEKVFVEFVHSVVADRCPDQFVFDDIFYNWNAGQEYTVPFSLSLPSSELFDILTIEGDTAVPLGQFDILLDVGGTLISSSSAGLVFYDDPNDTIWSTIGDPAFDLLSDFKGIDVDEPILLTKDESGHATRSIVRTNYSNEVFVIYQSTETGKSQIKLMGTVTPSSSLPVGYLDGRNIDSSLNSFFRPSDFIYLESITMSDDGINEHPDMFIDLNDVIHMSWQSNRDKYWEIYYANSNETFSATRITSVKSKSLKPSITGTDDGSIFVTWHDNRHGNYEVYLAFSSGTRVDPLFQQDPYLASFRNFSEGWSHTSDIIPIVITNDSNEAQCYTNFKVNFYEDRLLENLAFSVEQEFSPFAFNLPDLSSDEITSNFEDLNSWNTIKTFSLDFDTEEPYSIESQTFLVTSPEIDTSLSDSTISTITLPTLLGTCQLETIEFRASNTKDDSDANNQWTVAVDVSVMSGQTVTLADLGVSVSGQHQQVRIKFTCDATTDIFDLTTVGDDADREIGTGSWDADENSIRLGSLSSDTVYDSYLRFPITLPKNTKVINAFLSMKSSANSSGDLKSIIKLLNSDDVSSFGGTTTYAASITDVLSDTYKENSQSVAGAETDSKIIVGSSLGIGYEGYLRFLVNVPKSSQIINAFLTVVPNANYSGILNTFIYLLDGNDIGEFPARQEINSSIALSADDADLIITNQPFGNSSGFILAIGKTSNPPVNYNSYFRFNLPNVNSSSSIESAILKVQFQTGASAGTIQSQIIQSSNAPDFTPAFGLDGDGFINYQGLLGTANGIPNLGTVQINLPSVAAPALISVSVWHLLNEWKVLATGAAEQYMGIGMSTNQTTGQMSFLSIDGGSAATLKVVFGDATWPTPDFSESVLWIPPVWSSGVPTNSEDITTLVDNWLSSQSDGYISGNHMGLIIRDNGSSESREFGAFAGVGGSPSTITVVYSERERAVTPDAVVWNSSNWLIGTAIETSNISTLVQSYLSRSGYTPGQHIGFQIKDNSSDDLFEFTSFDSDPLTAAELVVTSTGDVDFNFSMTSVTPPRLCLPAGGSATGSLDITPTIRVDKLGNESTQIPLPIDYIPNYTYFTEITATEDSSGIIRFSDPKQSVSCESCFRQTNTWNSVSCSLQIQVPNESDESLLYDVFVNFYYDEERTQLINQLNTVSNLNCFTVDNMIPAQKVWTDSGFEVPSGGRLNMLLWPQLSSMTGLICGINYYVTVLTCSSAVGESRCNPSDSKSLSTEIWMCECQSARWDGRFEEAPVNLRELVRWRSSGFGFSDTRLTETLSDSFNPIVRMRRNLDGVVIYETNRKETPDQPDTVYKIYASVFSVKPAFDMYASAAEFITSPFTHLYHRSDIPICEGHPCFDDQGVRSSPTIEGRSPAFNIDPFDSIFLAVEKLDQNDECQELQKGNRQAIAVHRCGADALDLYPPDDEESPTTEPCDPSELTGKSLAESNDPIFQSTVRMIRVNNEDVFYHITRGNSAAAVVRKCDIRITVVGTPEAVAIRLRNGSGEWSQWQAFEPDIGENTMEISWSLTPSSGVKIVNFQVATYAGLATSASMTVIADFTSVSHTVKFFKSISGTTPLPINDDDPDLSDASPIWDLNNIVPSLEGVPVTAIRPSELQKGNEEQGTVDTIIDFVSDYIFVEITPSLDYLSQFSDGQSIEPSFDFIQQGGNDQFGIPTITGKRNEQTVFRGKIVIDREGITTSKDGLAFVVPHFVNDCSDESSISSVDTIFVRDKFNVPISGVSQSVTEVEDVWKNERDELGFIKHSISIRPTEDPYFIFGDPDYRLKKKDE